MINKGKKLGNTLDWFIHINRKIASKVVKGKPWGRRA
jgi:hypothetical protein